MVVGAGIAGLVAARQLGLAGWDVELLEKSAAPRPDGYMMDFFGPGVEAAERIGLYPRLAAVAYHVEAAEYVDATGRPTSSLDYDQFARLAGGKVLSLLRPDMERAALAALDDVAPGRVRVRYGAPVSRVWSDDDGVRVAVDGSPDVTIAADVLVGADGIHSGVRARVFGPEEEYLRPLGMRAAAFIVTEPILNARFRNRFVLTDSIDRMAGLYSLRSDEVAAFMVYRDATGAARAPAVREPAGAAAPRVRRTRPRGRPAAGTVPRASVRRCRRTDCHAGLAEGADRSRGGRLRGRIAPRGSGRLARHRRCRAAGGHPWTRGLTRGDQPRPSPNSSDAGDPWSRRLRPPGGAPRHRSSPRTGPSASCAGGSYGPPICQESTGWWPARSWAGSQSKPDTRHPQ